jgi:hypothetical protein
MKLMALFPTIVTEIIGRDGRMMFHGWKKGVKVILLNIHKKGLHLYA